jgi:threonine aldolase
MRQAGIIAAAGIVALETMVDRLAEDHENAKFLAQGLAHIPGILITPGDIETNIVIFRTQGIAWDAFMERLATQGVQISNYWGGLLRMVTHYGIQRGDVEYARHVVQDVMTGPE